MSEIRDFVQKAQRFLRSAQMLWEEGDYDSCVSRAYYAMFFMAEAALYTRDITASSHRGVIALFGEHFVKTGILGRELAKALSEAYDYRLMGDYAVGTWVSGEEAKRLLEQAKSFVSSVSAYLQEGRRE